MFNLEGQIALVTGAVGNLGFATASALQRAGARLVLVDREAGRLEQRFAHLSTGGHLLLGQVDVASPSAAAAAVQKAAAHFGRIDVLVNTVGAYQMGAITADDALDLWDSMFHANVRSAVAMCRAVAPHMLRQKSGRIVLTAARSGLAGSGELAAYSAAKSAVLRLTESLAEELHDSKVRVNAIIPGTIDTPQNRAALPGADHSKWVDPAALADAVLFLASDMSRGISGAALPVTHR